LLESLQLWLSLPDLLLHFLCTCALFLPNGIVENREFFHFVLVMAQKGMSFIVLFFVIGSTKRRYSELHIRTRQWHI
jgi:hypothetical protein